MKFWLLWKWHWIFNEICIKHGRFLCRVDTTEYTGGYYQCKDCDLDRVTKQNQLIRKYSKGI